MRYIYSCSTNQTDRPFAILLRRVWTGSSYHDTWEGEFEMSLEDKKQLDEDLPKEMQQRTRAAARIWRRTAAAPAPL